MTYNTNLVPKEKICCQPGGKDSSMHPMCQKEPCLQIFHIIPSHQNKTKNNNHVIHVTCGMHHQRYMALKAFILERASTFLLPHIWGNLDVSFRKGLVRSIPRPTKYSGLSTGTFEEGCGQDRVITYPKVSITKNIKSYKCH